MRAKRVVLATGAHERPLVFPDNDRPGIMLAEAARTLVARYGVKPGARVVVATAHDSAYRAALELAAAGVEIAMIADLAPSADGALPQAARLAGLRVETNAAIVGSHGDSARHPRADRQALGRRRAERRRTDRLRSSSR